MPTIDKTNGTGIPLSGTTKDYTISNTIVMSAIAGLLTGDVIQALNVKAGTLVRKVLVKINTALTGTSGSVTVGDGADADGFDTAVDLKGAAGTISQTQLGLTEATPNTLIDAFAAGKVYTAADTIDLTLTSDTVTAYGTVTVIALCTDLN